MWESEVRQSRTKSRTKYIWYGIEYYAGIPQRGIVRCSLSTVPNNLKEGGLMAEQQVTCGVLFKQLLEELTDMNSESILRAGAFFIAGQAEKVYLGACPAAMSRPSAGYFGKQLENIWKIAQIYDLKTATYPDEIWICRKEYIGDVDRMRMLPVNSPAWHHARARLCGIPLKEVDEQFHLRSGYGERAD